MKKMLLFMAVIMVVLALLAVRCYVNRMQGQFQAQWKGDMVVAAARDIPAEVEITKDMLGFKSVPRQFIPALALNTNDDVKLVLGRKARFSIPAGQILAWSDLESERSEGLSGLIPEGRRAFTISVARGIKPSGLRPNDHIDIIGSFAVPRADQSLSAGGSDTHRPSDMVNMVLLQNVAVLPSGDGLGASSSSGSGGGGNDLILALTLQEAQLLMMAAEHGELGAVLRPWESTDVQTALPRITFDTVINPK